MKKLILIAALLAPASAVAAPGDSAARKSTQMVCKAIAETGSRLSKRKLCMTREQWAEQKRIQRLDLERAQTRRLEPRSGN